MCVGVFCFQARLAEFKYAGFDVDLEFLDCALIAVQGRIFVRQSAFFFFFSYYSLHHFLSFILLFLLPFHLILLSSGFAFPHSLFLCPSMNFGYCF